MISHMQMVTVYIADMKKAVAFYTEKLGFTVHATFQDEQNYFIWVIPGETENPQNVTWIGLFETEANDPRIGNCTNGMVFTAVDVEKTYYELKEKGVHFTLDLIRHSYGEGDGDLEVRFVDQDDNEFLLHS